MTHSRRWEWGSGLGIDPKTVNWSMFLCERQPGVVGPLSHDLSVLRIDQLVDVASRIAVFFDNEPPFVQAL